MATDPPADPPKTETTSTASTNPPAETKPEVEYDDFGLPVRKPRARTPVVDSSDTEEEKFEDAVATKSMSKEEAALPEKEEKLVKTRSVSRSRERPGPTTKEGYALPQLNGRVKSRIDTIEQKETEHDEPPRLESPERKRRVREVSISEERENASTKETVEERQAQEKSETPADAEKATLLPAAEKESHVLSQDEPASATPKEEAAQIKETTIESNGPPEPTSATANKEPLQSPSHRAQASLASLSEFSHQRATLQPQKENKGDDMGEWQVMPAYAHYDMYDDDNKLIAKENSEALEDMHGYANVGGAAKGYTRVIVDDDVDSVTSMDDNTAYLFKEQSNALDDDDEAARDPQSQMQATKNLLTEGQRVAYVGLVRLAIVEMEKRFVNLTRNRGTKKALDMQQETTKMWAQLIMLRLYKHMDIDASEQIMIEQLSQHGVVPADLTPALMQNARIKNPVAEEISSPKEGEAAQSSEPKESLDSEKLDEKSKHPSKVSLDESIQSPPPPYEEHEDGYEYPQPKTPSQLPDSKNLDIDLRWTVMCDLFLLLISDGVYDSRSRELFEQVGKYLAVDWLEICRFEKRVTDALEMQEQADKENWNEDDHMKARAKKARNKRLAFMGLATVGGGLVIGLSAGLLAPVIGAGLAAGFTTIGVAGTGTFLAGAGGAAIVTTTGVVTGSTVGLRAANRRTGNVKTFEYRPLHNNKRTNLIITLAGWMNGKVDDVRLPYSTVDPIMGDIYSVLWEPEMLRSMGDTINILATEALTQGLQQVLAGTILYGLMTAMTLPLALTKLSYLIDNPWIVSQARADMAGLILADSIMERNLGTRPITLVGFSLGARVIFSALKELAVRGAVGLVQNVYMFGTPVVAKNDDYIRARSVVPGRFVNGYATNDWILGYLFRATSGGVMRVAGLAPVQAPTVENINVTELVPGHMAYRTAMPKLLREVGWEIESDEFTEIEDPDPDNHEKRQRELINEIEEARKELQKKNAEKEQKGRKVSWWKRKKADKKGWEVYDESSQKPAPIDPDGDPAKIAENPVMFDIDAIRKEVASLAAENKPYDAPEEDFEIKEIKSTLPPMKIDLPPTAPAPSPVPKPHDSLRVTKSYNDSLGASTSSPDPTTNGTRKQSYDEYDEFDYHGNGESNVEMTFDTSFHDSPAPPKPAASPIPDRPASPWQSTTPSRSPMPEAGNGWSEPTTLPERPPLYTSKTAPQDPLHNAWADEFEDDFGQEKEVKMSFM